MSSHSPFHKPGPDRSGHMCMCFLTFCALGTSPASPWPSLSIHPFTTFWSLLCARPAIAQQGLRGEPDSVGSRRDRDTKAQQRLSRVGEQRAGRGKGTVEAEGDGFKKS